MFEKKGFFPIEDQDVRLRLIREAAKSSSWSTVWTRNRSILFRSTISNFDISSGSFRVALPKDMTLEKVLSIVGDREGTFFNIELQNSQILFRTQIHRFEENNPFLEFKIPEEMYRTQQRKHPRINTSKNDSVKAFHDDPIHPGRMIRRKVLDLSAGGIAVHLFAGEERHYHSSQRINPFQLHIGHKIFSCWVEVKNLRVISKSGASAGLTMGLEFHNLSESSRNQITAYIDQIVVKEFGDMFAEKDSSEEKKDESSDPSGGDK